MSTALNVLLIVVDQWRGDTISHLGHPCVRTPNLDMLCREGVTFRNNFTQGVPCGPARASLLTGQYMMNHRVTQNGVPMDTRHYNLADALREAGAVPTLFYRNEERGLPVAKSLGIEGALLSDIDDSFEVYINSTPLGTYPDDASPVPADVFTRSTQIAFDMVYQTPQTRFLRDAADRGARCIPGREMLVSQGIEQFIHFTGHEPPQSEFQANFERGRILRGMD